MSLSEQRRLSTWKVDLGALTLDEIIDGQEKDFRALCCNDPTTSLWFLAIFTLLLPFDKLKQLLVAENLVQLQLFDLVFDSTLRSTDLPRVGSLT